MRAKLFDLFPSGDPTKPGQTDQPECTIPEPAPKPSSRRGSALVLDELPGSKPGSRRSSMAGKYDEIPLPPPAQLVEVVSMDNIPPPKKAQDKRAAASLLAKQQAAAAKKQDKKPAGKLEQSAAQRQKQLASKPGRKKRRGVPDFDKLHAREFAKERSLKQHVDIKQNLKDKASTPAKPSPAVDRAQQIKDRRAAAAKQQRTKPVARKENKQPPAGRLERSAAERRKQLATKPGRSNVVEKKVICGGGRVEVRKVIQGGQSDRSAGTWNKSTVASAKKVKSNRATEAEAKKPAGKPKFDLKASLAKKPTWKMKTGKLHKFTDTTNVPNSVM